MVPKRENDASYMNIYDEHMIIKGRAALEKLSGHMGVYYLAQGHLSSTLKVSQHLPCYQPYNQNLTDLLKLWIKQLVAKHHRPDPKISSRQTQS